MCPKLQHYPWGLNLFSGGATIDVSADSLLREAGDYLDSQNMRPTALTGHAGDIAKIHGEISKYANIDNRCIGGTGAPMPLTYFCLGSAQVLDHIVEFWVDELGVGVPYVRVDGWIVLMPTTLIDFPLSFNYPLQIDTNDSCVGGEVFVTDNHIPPFIFNVADLLENSGINPATGVKDGKYPCTQKYFTDFNVTQYQIQPPTQQDHPQFIELMGTGSTPNSLGNAVVHGSGGMKVGMYQYWIQYVDSSGNVTNWSEATPQIPVPANDSVTTSAFSATKVYGGYPATVSTSGIHIRFRITNTNNYASINIRRTSWNAGAAIGTPANDDSVIDTINITDGQIGIVDFYDNDNSTVSPITTSASTQNNLTAIQAAKTLRYYNSRLTLMNITYASRDLTNNVTFNTANGVMYPFIRPLGQEGYKDIWNDVYRKTYFRGERYGFALLCFDTNGNASFALPLNFGTAPHNLENYQMPNRRDKLTGVNLVASTELWRTSGNLLPLASAANSVNAVSQTYEVFDMNNATQRDSSVAYGPVNGGNVPNSATKSTNPITIIDDSGTFGVPDKRSGQNPNGYNPFRPVSDGDGGDNSLGYVIDSSVNDGSASDPTINFSSDPPDVYSGFLPYNPKGFLPNLYALGMVMDGITNLPEWVSAFTIVRTAPAGRVIAQGQGFYNFNGNASPPGWQNTNTTKDTNGYIFHSPDIDTGVANIGPVVTSTASARYNFQVVSPLGFFTEMFSGYSPSTYIVDSVSHPGVVGSDRGIDMICYARILTDMGEFNPIASGATMAGIADSNGRNFVSFASWRNANNSITPNEEFQVGYFDNTFSTGNYCTGGSNPRIRAYYLRSAVSGIYANAATGGPPNGIDYNQTNVKNWHEPVYVTNIVDDTQNIVNGLVQDYYQTGTWVKISSIIGQFTGSVNSFILVDERWQDCIPAELITDPLATEDRYVYVKDSNGNTNAWINVTYKNATQLAAIQAAIASAGFYVSTRCDGTQVQCYGMYSHTIMAYNLQSKSLIPFTGSTGSTVYSAGEKFYYVNFDQKDSSGNAMLPPANSYIIVNYDYCAPIEVFGGDSYIGEHTYPIADCQFNSSADPSSSQDTFIIDRPLPYRAFQINENTLQIHENDPTVGSLSIIGNNLVRFYHTFLGINEHSYIRQMLVNGIVESRTNTALLFDAGNDYQGSFYPNINYVVRPFQWRSGKETVNIQSQYFSDYGGNYYTNWIYGGFNINPQYNVDYSEIPTADKAYSKPSSGFTEKLNFCSRALWSDRRSTNEQNSPNLRNFPATNVYDFDDATGEIKFAWDSSNAGQQGNLYAVTEHGVVMGETNKSILTEISGNQLAVMGNSDDTFIQSEVWLTRSIGMNDQMWRSKAEYDNRLYFANKESVYRLYNNQVKDIDSETNRYGSVTRNFLASVGPGYSTDVTAVWNQKYEEYWLCLNVHRQIIYIPKAPGAPVSLYNAPPSPPIPFSYVVYQDSILDIQTNVNLYLNTLTGVTEIYIVNNTGAPITVYPVPGNNTIQTNILPGVTVRAYWNPAANSWSLDPNMINYCNDLIYSEITGKWVGQYKYRFDKYVSDIYDNVYGSRLGATFLLDTGYTMNGQNVGAWVLQAFCPKEGYNQSKEFIRIRINSDTKPDYVYFYQSIENYYSGNFHSFIDASATYALKNYGSVVEPSWEQYCPRGFNSPYLRNQSRFAIYQIMCSEPVEFNLSSVSIQWKPLL